MVDYVLTGPSHGPLVVVMGGISADRHASDRPDGGRGWWGAMVGPGRPVDTRRVRVLGIDWLGRTDGHLRWRNGAARDSDGTPSPRYPLISTHDQAAALVHVLDEIGAQRVQTLIGASYGGMVGLAFAADFPDRLDHLVVISAAHRTHPMATAHRAVQRGIVELARKGGSAADGLVLARALAMTTYRTADEFDARFSMTPIAPAGHRFEVEEYLEAQGMKFRERFDPDEFACLSHSIDLHSVDPARVRTPTDLISVDSDTLVPPWLMRELETGMDGPCRHRCITSAAGHDAFLKEVDTIGALLSEIIHAEGHAA